MAKRGPIDATFGPHRVMIGSQNHAIAIVQRDHFRPAGPPEIALDHQGLAPVEIPAGFVEQERGLERENVFAVQILMWATIVALVIAQQQRRPLALTGAEAHRAKKTRQLANAVQLRSRFTYRTI